MRGKKPLPLGVLTAIATVCFIVLSNKLAPIVNDQPEPGAIIAQTPFGTEHVDCGTVIGGIHQRRKS